MIGKPKKEQRRTRRSSAEATARPSMGSCFKVFQESIGVPTATVPSFYHRLKIGSSFTLAIEDFLPELEISSGAIKSLFKGSSLNGSYFFNGSEKPVLKCEESKGISESNIPINCYIRPQTISAIRIKKIEMREICENLSKSICTASKFSAPQFTDYMKVGVILSLGQNTSRPLCKVIAAFPDLCLVLSAIKPFSLSSESLPAQYGFLGMSPDHRTIIPLSFHDINTKSLPLVGAWIMDGAKKGKHQDELIMSVILRFLFCEEVGPRASQDRNSFVFVKFNSKSAQPQFYSFHVKPASNAWVMLVSSNEIDYRSSLKVQLTTKKQVAKQQSNCSLYKLSRAVSMLADGEIEERNPHSRNCDSNKENLGSKNFMRLSMQDIKSSANPLSEIPTVPKETAAKPIKVIQINPKEKPVDLDKQNSRNSLLGSGRGSLPPSGRERSLHRSSTGRSIGSHRSGSMGASGRRSSSVTKRIIAQQQMQIQLLQQQIFQTMNTLNELKSKGTAIELPAEIPVQNMPVFDLNSRFKANMANCQQLNISNNFGQASPSFMNNDEEGRSSRKSMRYTERLSVPEEYDTRDYNAENIETGNGKAHVTNNPVTVLKMYNSKKCEALSAIKETNESVTSPEGNSSESTKKNKGQKQREIRKIDFTVPKIVFNEDI